MDRYLDCVIYINNGSVSSSEDLYTTLAHEGYPGHLYQNVYFLSNCTSPVRTVLSFGSYVEGWATYVENYAYTTDNGLSPELGQLLAYNASSTLDSTLSWTSISTITAGIRNRWPPICRKRSGSRTGM